MTPAVLVTLGPSPIYPTAMVIQLGLWGALDNEEKKALALRGQLLDTAIGRKAWEGIREFAKASRLPVPRAMQ